MENVIVVYGVHSGNALVVTFLGNQWWCTSKDERLEPLFEGSPFDGLNYHYLCEKDQPIQAKDLAGMMGCALMSGEEDPRESMRSRFKEINALGVKFQAVPQVLNLKIHVYEHNGTKRNGKYSLSCDDCDNAWMRLFDLDGFETPKAAMSWAKAYIDFFVKHGVSVRTTLKCTEDVFELLAGETTNMKLEIENL